MSIIKIEDIRHGIRVANLSIEIGKRIYLSKRKIDDLYISGLFHDIGKAFLDQDILNKPGILNSYERKHIEKHSIYSYNEILKLKYSEDIALNILHHHENYDGTGYPEGLKGNQIPLGARILKVCDVYDALTMERPYREKLSREKALNIISKEKEKFDSEIYNVFMNYISENEMINNRQIMSINFREDCLNGF